MGYIEKATPISNLPKEKWALATATTADVLNGKTFYSGDKVLKTGALVCGISVRGAGATSSTYSLPAGTYKFEYMSACFSSSGNCPNCYIYVNNSLKYTGASTVHNTSYNGVDYAAKSGETTITLTETSDVRISTSAGNFNPYAFCSLIRTS